MQLTGQSIIGYRRGAISGTQFRGFNPANGEALPPVYYSAAGTEVSEAAGLAAECFTTYGRLSGKDRGHFLRRIAQNLEDSGKELIDRAVLESALPATRIRNEVGRTCFQLRFFAGILDEGSWVDVRINSGDPVRQPLPKPDIRSMLRPLGPIAVFCASNFPLAFSVAGGDTASALAAGNPVIALAHYSHPGTAELAGMAIRTAALDMQLPDGVFSLLYDSAQNVAHDLVGHPQIKGVGFTGSHSGGTALMRIAFSRPGPIPFYAEMGSVNPVFILPGAQQSRAESLASALHASVTVGAGQFCTNPGIVITTGGDDAFVLRFASLMRDSPAVIMLNSRIAFSYRDANLGRMGNPRVVARAVQANAIELRENNCQSGTALFETDAASWLADRTLHNEIFGPSTLLVHTQYREELLEIARQLEGNLTATVHGTEEDFREFSDLIAILETKVGRIIFNGFPTAVEVCQAMVHGGPFPATSDGRSTSVGGRAIHRFTRAVCFQDCPESALPDELKTANPLAIWRLVDDRFEK